MFRPVKSPYLVPFDGSFKIHKCPTEPPKNAPKRKQLEEELAQTVEVIGRLQRRLFACDNHAILLVFQALDAAGKDSTIRAVLAGVDQAGCQVSAFKAPSHEELDHDFLWRTVRALPERGRIGVFNRSYYEEVLTVRVHPELLDRQKLPRVNLDTIWDERLESIRNHELHLHRNGTVVLKFWLNVSREEQRKRLLSRLEDPEKNWKFDIADLAVRQRWDHYMTAYEQAIRATSRPEAPWYVIPADDKPYMRRVVAGIVRETLAKLALEYPPASAELREQLAWIRQELQRGE